MKRRDFFTLAASGATLPLVAPALAAPVATPGAVAEPARELPVSGAADVVVCGAGPAGVAAAIAAARKGAKTALIETHGCLGGIWTAGALTWILDYANKPGLMSEIFKGLEARGGRAMKRDGHGTGAADTEVMKLLLEELCAKAGVEIQLHTRVCAAIKDGGKRLTHVVTESKSGREAFQGKLFIDCTGDGDLAARAGCGFDYGAPESGVGQPFSLIALVTGIHAAEVAGFYRDDDRPSDWAQPKDRLRAEMERAGHSPSYSKPSMFRVRDDFFIVMINHEYGVKGTDARDVTRATLHARKELHTLVDGLRSLGGVWKNIRLVATAEQIGVRESRRIHGLYTVSAEDLRLGRTHEDAVCKATFGIDVHSTGVKNGKAIEKAGFKAKPYDIPLRALIARDVQGLMMAGRCISGDFIAHSSYRVTGNAVALGEAAGKAAAAAALSGRFPQEVKISELA